MINIKDKLLSITRINLLNWRKNIETKICQPVLPPPRFVCLKGINNF